MGATNTHKLFLFFFFSFLSYCSFALMCTSSVSALVLRRTSLPVQPVRCFFHPEGQPAASHQAPFRGEALQVSPVQLRLPQEGRPHRPSAHPFGWVCSFTRTSVCTRADPRTARWKPLHSKTAAAHTVRPQCFVRGSWQHVDIMSLFFFFFFFLQCLAEVCVYEIWV